MEVKDSLTSITGSFYYTSRFCDDRLRNGDSHSLRSRRVHAVKNCGPSIILLSTAVFKSISV
ncbi:MAG: hypothetical protein R6U89_12755, partial [Dehalococcoidia bacterium]